EEVAAYEPDLFIIYSGHNEFLENRTYATIRERNPALVWADSLLSGTRIYSALRSSIGLLRDASSGERSVLAEEVSPVLDQSIGPDAYTRDDVLTKNVLEHYRFNLDRMLRIAEDAGADAILVTPASNLKDCSPFKSEYSAGLTEDDRLRFSESLERGRRHLRAGELDAARHELATAVRIDPRRADAHYLLGRALLAQNEGTAAERELRQAIDEDVCPLRALSPIRGIVREVAQLRGTALIDFAALLEDAARREFGDGIPGEEYFLDHVHPTIEGNRKLALALVDVMAERDWIDLSPGWNAAALDAVTARVRGRIDRNEQGIALRNLAKVLSWAGKSEDAAQLARRSLALLGEDAEDSFILGAEAAESGRHDEAARHYRDAIRLEADYVKAWNNLGISLVRTGRDEEAIEAYREALHLAPAHASARFNLANALQRTGQFDAAIAHYRELVRMSPEDADAHFNLARAYERQGELALAVDHYRETLEITPGDEDAHHALAELQNALGRSAEADAHFAKSDSIDSAP
ncbi:MAG: tetratricopeptide repeat protein, partial [Myxococcota bacterium]